MWYWKKPKPCVVHDSCHVHRWSVSWFSWCMESSRSCHSSSSLDQRTPCRNTIKHTVYNNRKTHHVLCGFFHLLVRDDLKNQVVQESELLGYLQGRMALEGFSLTVVHGLIHTHTHTLCVSTMISCHTWESFFPLTICVISSRVTWLSPGSSWERVLETRKAKVPLFNTSVWASIDLEEISGWQKHHD